MNNFGNTSSCAFLKYSGTISLIPQIQVLQDTPLRNLRGVARNHQGLGATDIICIFLAIGLTITVMFCHIFFLRPQSLLCQLRYLS